MLSNKENYSINSMEFERLQMSQNNNIILSQKLLISDLNS